MGYQRRVHGGTCRNRMVLVLQCAFRVCHFFARDFVPAEETMSKIMAFSLLVGSYAIVRLCPLWHLPWCFALLWCVWAEQTSLRQVLGVLLRVCDNCGLP